MRKWICLVLVLCVPFAAFAEGADVLNAFLSGDYKQIEGMLNEEMRAAIGADALAQGWQMQLAQLGAFVAVHEVSEQGGAQVLTLKHENGAQNLIVAYDGDGKIAGLMLQPAVIPQEDDRALPENAAEVDVLLFAGTEKELRAQIIAPQEAAAYVVLAHGSGPSDMDETIAANRPFRDLAYDLAALGVGSIRFDKITYAHPDLPCETVEQEYLAPVREALRVLKEHTGTEDAYLIGHSLGGMLMPWLVEQCGFAGGAALAGTPRKLWEISYQQNLDTIALLPPEQQGMLKAQVEAERQRALALAEMSDEEARGVTVFGMSAVYLRHMEKLDQAAIAKTLQKPMLFLWGENAVQVSREAFEAWQEQLGHGEWYQYEVLPGLNHLFMPSDGSANVATVMAEYSIPARMDSRVAQIIRSWLE